MGRSQIIKDLANSKCDLAISLKRTKVLIKLLGDDRLINWINSEIEGYKEEKDIPRYRKLKGNFIGTYTLGTFGRIISYNNVPIPLGNMPIKDKENFLTSYFKQGIPTLEQILKDSEAMFSKFVSTDICRAIEKLVGNPYFSIVSGNVVVDKMEVMNIISYVENSLLDVLMLLEKKFGNLDELDIDVESKDNEEIENIKNAIYVMIFNDNSVIIGNNNKIKDSTIGSNIEVE